MQLPGASGWHVRALQVLRSRLSDFALDSMLSRAAARALLARKLAWKSPHKTGKAVEMLSVFRKASRSNLQVGTFNHASSITKHAESPSCLRFNSFGSGYDAGKTLSLALTVLPRRKSSLPKI